MSIAAQRLVDHSKRLPDMSIGGYEGKLRRGWMNPRRVFGSESEGEGEGVVLRA